MVWAQASSLVFYFLVSANTKDIHILTMGTDEAVTDPTCQIPLVKLPDSLDEDSKRLSRASQQVVNALETSGFLLVTSKHLPFELQKQAIGAAAGILNSKENPSVVNHPVDPKNYIMLESLEDISKSNASENEKRTLTDYWNALDKVKCQLLKCIAVGLNLPLEYFVDLHRNNNSALRLLHYPAATKSPQAEQPSKPSTSANEDNQLKIRCKSHSDYGSITLLLTDGVPGLQALIQEKWTSMPHVEGALVVNIGTLLSEWSNGKLLATLHRVISIGDPSKPRTSVAFFADPDQEVSARLQESPEGVTTKHGMSVAEYIQWRSGGSGRQRSGLAFTAEEEERAKKVRIE